jgi:hypothetical protein
VGQHLARSRGGCEHGELPLLTLVVDGLVFALGHLRGDPHLPLGQREHNAGVVSVDDEIVRDRVHEHEVREA